MKIVTGFLGGNAYRRGVLLAFVCVVGISINSVLLKGFVDSGCHFLNIQGNNYVLAAGFLLIGYMLDLFKRKPGRQRSKLYEDVLEPVRSLGLRLKLLICLTILSKIAGFAFILLSYQYNSALVTELILKFTPFFLLFFALALKEKEWNLSNAIGTSLTVFGVCLVVIDPSGKFSASYLGILTAIIAAFLYAVNIKLSGTYVRDLSSRMLTSWTILIGLFFITGSALISGEFHFLGECSLIIFVLINISCGYLMYRLLKRYSRCSIWKYYCYDTFIYFSL